MNPITIKSKVGTDGVLHLDLPLGIDSACEEVQVTVQPVSAATLTQEQWREMILSTAGKWQGNLERPEQGAYEEREPLS